MRYAISKPEWATVTSDKALHENIVRGFVEAFDFRPQDVVLLHHKFYNCIQDGYLKEAKANLRHHLERDDFKPKALLMIA